MKFRTKVELPIPDFFISQEQSIFSIGSCFANEMATQLQQFKFNINHNPFGILFHPIAIENALLRIYTNTQYTSKELFKHNYIYHSWDHHSAFSHSNQEEVLQNINTKISISNTFLRNTDVVIITLGTAFIYFLKSLDLPVANCHKVPNNKFYKSLTSLPEITNVLQNCIKLLNDISSKNIKIIFTISPVRHLKNGTINNTRSKSILIEAVHQICEENNNCMYFPAYEILLDELRDYRFYEEDMIHPNTQAKKYILECFSKTFFSEETQKLNSEIFAINQQLNHKPHFKDSLQHKQSILKLNQKIKQIIEKHPYINFSTD